MAINLIVGTNTYIELEDAELYHITYGNADWIANTDDEIKKQALVLATQSLDLLYGDKYLSYMLNEMQPLLFPRATFYDNDGRIQSGIPECLASATAEVALLQINGVDIFPLENVSRNINSEYIKIGDLATSYKYSGSPQTESYPEFRKVDLLLRPILKSLSASWRIAA